MAKPRKPTALLKLTGMYRRDRHGAQNEPQPNGLPVMPVDLPAPAAAFWMRTVPGLIETGVATAADQSALEHMAIWWAVWEELADMLRLHHTERGNKWVYELAVAEKNWIGLAARFGMTPSDRTKINATPKDSINPAKEYVI